MAPFKRSRKAPDGSIVKSGNWHIEFFDHMHIQRRLPAFSNKSASQEFERAIKKAVEYRKVGLDPDPGLTKFLECCPRKILLKLAEWGIVAGTWAILGTGFEEHIEGWKESLEANGKSRFYITEASNKVRRIVKESGWKTLADISTAGLEKWRSSQTKLGKATLNHYCGVMGTFCNWLIREKRLGSNPLVHMKKLNADKDRRYVRRPFTTEEMCRILTAAANGEKALGLTGHERFLLYWLVYETGLRHNECRTLEKSSFCFNEVPATVTIKAKNAKNGKDATLPLRDRLAAALKTYYEPLEPTIRPFGKLRVGRGADMLRIDLEAAGIPEKDEQGRIRDFHAIRGTFATQLARSGVPLQAAQKMMRHSDPKLTSNFYTHLQVEEKAEELAKLPEIVIVPVPGKKAVKPVKNTLRASKAG